MLEASFNEANLLHLQPVFSPGKNRSDEKAIHILIALQSRISPVLVVSPVDPSVPHGRECIIVPLARSLC